MGIVSNDKFDFSYGKKELNKWFDKAIITIDEYGDEYRSGPIDKNIKSIVRGINKYDWCMTWQSCGGHKFEDGSIRKPLVEFIIKEDNFFDFLKRKSMDFNHYIGLRREIFKLSINLWDSRELITSNHTLSSPSMRNTINVDGIIPIIYIRFNCEKKEFKSIERIFLSWFEEYDMIKKLER